jgi:DNA helicase IV
MRERAEELAEGTDRNDLDLWAALVRRAGQLAETARPLCFGRIDTVDGETWHIGRRHVEDGAGDPVVVEWRTPIAVPFYRASPRDPAGLRRRRQFIVDGRQVHSMADDIFGGAGHDLAVPRLRGGDALMAELERSRRGEMLDIVATIQTEQDEVIRARQAGVLAVQGGPGSGKTAVGLHRAAFLLYGNDALARQGVLILGPNRTFLRYISQVLPSLGEEAVVQTTVQDLLSGIRVQGIDPWPTARIKGDARMSVVLRTMLDNRRQTLDADLVVPWSVTQLVVSSAVANAAAASIAASGGPWEAGRDALRQRLTRLLMEQHSARFGDDGSTDYAEVSRAVRAHRSFKAALDRLWPAVSATTLVRDVLNRPARLQRAADGLLTTAEQRALKRRTTPARQPEPWTSADIALIDEASQLVSGRGRSYGHIVVDEAQDLSPMQLRMLGRRCPTASMTLLGDLAQATGAWAYDSWDELLSPLDTPDGARTVELRLGYRAPAQVLDLASRLLPLAAPHIRPTESVRAGRSAPSIIPIDIPIDIPIGPEVEHDERVDPMARAEIVARRAAGEAARLAQRYGSVAVIGPTAAADGLRRALVESGVDLGLAAHGTLDHPVTLVIGTEAKGLEFDAVVVVEPAALVDDAPRGLRLLYVAMTRPTQHLSIVHSLPLPDPLISP